jgi:hypothetical protein
MKSVASNGRQVGATLIVGLIMLAMLTLMVLSAANMSTGNLKIVGNLQFRDEAIAAGNFAIEQFITANFPANMSAEPVGGAIAVDIDRDGTPDYTAAIAAPVCLLARAVPASELDVDDPKDESCFVGSSLTPTLGGSGGATSFCTATQWEITATVTSDADTGAAVVIRQGIDKRMATQAALNYCE